MTLPINSNIQERMKQKELEKQQREEAERQRQAAEDAKRKEAMELLSMSMGCKVNKNSELKYPIDGLNPEIFPHVSFLSLNCHFRGKIKKNDI